MRTAWLRRFSVPLAANHAWLLAFLWDWWCCRGRINSACGLQPLLQLMHPACGPLPLRCLVLLPCSFFSWLGLPGLADAALLQLQGLPSAARMQAVCPAEQNSRNKAWT